MKFSLVHLCALTLALLCLVRDSALAAGWIWAKGNLHTHTTNSDGDIPPKDVAEWYRNHGYQFLVITDHNKVTNVADIDNGSNDGFVLISGEEVAILGTKVPIHVNAIGITETLAPPHIPGTRSRSLAKLVDSIRSAGGIPMVNHPNFYWSLSHREILQVKAPYLLEVLNAHPYVNTFGNAAFMPVEQTWDILLSKGKTVYAAATDDAHNFKETKPHLANPGRAWVFARVPELTREAILAALAKGDFYASTGVELADYGFDGKEFRVCVKPKEGQKCLIRFIGKWGEILQETTRASASYQVAGKSEPNSYIRCKVIAGDGTVAWTQAYRIKD
ncbi:MAG TPA: CehA/McbA family metallohydrolase [Armatimonadota bacterium]|nr:CehA/McbA family metallohydrolase [Armatimonadota bacterium]